MSKWNAGSSFSLSGDPMYDRGCSKGAPESDLICAKDFLQSWDLDAFEAVRIKTNLSEEEKVAQISKRMKVEAETVKELSDVCSVQNLLCGSEPSTKKRLLLMKEAPGINLKCVSHQMQQRKLHKESNSMRTSHSRHMKYSHLNEFWFLKKAGMSRAPADPENQVLTPNIIMSVQITKCRLHGKEGCKRPVTETFAVLGSQTLADLKDAIKCPTNSVIAGDFSALPDVDKKTLVKSGETYKSAFFFIENIFYNDLRQADNKDYSKPIIEWAKTNWPDSKMSVGDMATTTFLDLKLRLGHYYLYTHQGLCEHSVQFQDMRLFTSEDCQDATRYPMRIVERITARKLCQGCTKISAGWIVLDSPLIPTDPCFLCQKCFKSLLYTPDGEKTSNFKAYHFAEYFA